MKDRGNSFLRFLDRFFGIPCVMVLTLFKKKRKIPNKIDSIALLKSAGIGDTILLSGIIADLKKAFPLASICLFTGASNFQAGNLIAEIEVKKVPLPSLVKSFRVICHRPFDVWIDCDPWPRINAILSFFAPKAFRIGFRTKGQCRHWLYDQVVIHRQNRHEIDNYRELAAYLGVISKSPPKLRISNLPKAFQEKKIVCHLFSAGSKAFLKQWPLENWEVLIKKLVCEDWTVYLSGSVKDAPSCEALAKKFQSQVSSIAGKYCLEETARFIASCKACISIDTGLMHLSAAIDVATICLHGPTSPKRWGAIGKHVFAVTPSINYTPCISLGFDTRCKNNVCMRKIDVTQVLSALTRLLKE